MPIATDSELPERAEFCGHQCVEPGFVAEHNGGEVIRMCGIELRAVPIAIDGRRFRGDGAGGIIGAVDLISEVLIAGKYHIFRRRPAGGDVVGSIGTARRRAWP